MSDDVPPAGIGNKVIEILRCVESGQYDEAIRKCARSRVSAEAFERVIREYGRTPASPPEDAIQKLVYMRIAVSENPEWFVDVPFWTKEEGISDLCLQLIVEINKDNVLVEIHDFLVP